MSDFETMKIKGVTREIKHELSGIIYKKPDFNMIGSLEEVKNHISMLQDMIADIVVAEEDEDE